MSRTWIYGAVVALLGVGMVLGQSGCFSAGADFRSRPADPEWLHASMKRLTDVMVHDIFSPPQASRTYAYASVAAYEALAGGDPAFRSLAGQLNDLGPAPAPEGDVYRPLAAVHALLTVGQAQVFTEADVADFREQMHDHFREMMPRDVFDASVAYGDAVAAHVLAWADADLYRETRSYPKFTVLDEPGRWQPTPPAYLDGIEPHWSKIRPFVLDSASQFRPPPPPPFDMTEGSPFHREVMTVYEAGLAPTEEERAIASFWDCNPYVMHTRGHLMFATKKITPGGHWIGITAIAARQAGLDLTASAEAYAHVAVALADGFISSWDEKYRSNLIRPETVINQHVDEAWVPLLQTPPFPEHTSGHSVISTAAAVALTDLLGDGFAFDDTSEVEFGLPVRSFDSFEAAAAEAAISRLYGGIHYLPAIRDGQVQGRRVGELVGERVQTRAPAVAQR